MKIVIRGRGGGDEVGAALLIKSYEQARAQRLWNSTHGYPARGEIRLNHGNRRDVLFSCAGQPATESFALRGDLLIWPPVINLAAPV